MRGYPGFFIFFFSQNPQPVPLRRGVPQHHGGGGRGGGHGGGGPGKEQLIAAVRQQIEYYFSVVGLDSGHLGSTPRGVISFGFWENAVHA